MKFILGFSVGVLFVLVPLKFASKKVERNLNFYQSCLERQAPETSIKCMNEFNDSLDSLAH